MYQKMLPTSEVPGATAQLGGGVPSVLGPLVARGLSCWVWGEG